MPELDESGRRLLAFDTLIADITTQRTELRKKLDEAEERLALQAENAEASVAQINTLNAKIEELTKKLASETSTKDMYRQRDSDKEKKIEQIHMMLDGLPGVMPRRVEVPDNYGNCSKQEACVLTRFVSYLGTLVAR